MALEKLNMWLWDNEEGMHITVDVNYGLSTHKRAFFSLKGENTLNKWKAYNDKQPSQLREYFGGLKEQYRQQVKDIIARGHAVRISKLATNTGTKGRRVMNGMIMLYDTREFVVVVGEHEFSGRFETDGGTMAQRNNSLGGKFLGEWRWQRPRAEDELWESAY